MSGWKLAIIAALATTTAWGAKHKSPAVSVEQAPFASTAVGSRTGHDRADDIDEQDDWRDAPGSRRDDAGMWLAVGSFALMSFMVYRWISEDERPPTIFR